MTDTTDLNDFLHFDLGIEIGQKIIAYQSTHPGVKIAWDLTFRGYSGEQEIFASRIGVAPSAEKVEVTHG